MLNCRRPPSGAFALVLIGAVLAATSGCAAIKATEQPDKKNLALLTAGVPRTHLIAELGAPTWSEEREGIVTDVFAFKQGYRKGVKAGRALVHGAADVATAGLWEVVGIPAETLADGTDVKVSVSYDTSQLVDAVEVIEGEKAVNPPRWFGLKKARQLPTSTHAAPAPKEHELPIAEALVEAPEEDLEAPEISLDFDPDSVGSDDPIDEAIDPSNEPPE